MEINKVLHVATFAGQIILESGGETYRVEETICRICSAFGATYADSFVTPTGIMVSISDENHYTKTLVKRVKVRTVDLQKVHLVNELSRNIQINDYSLAEVHNILLEISETKRYSLPLTLASSAVSAGCFAILFGGNFEDALASLIVGFFIKSFCVIAENFNINGFFINSISGAIGAFLAILLYNIGLGSNLDTIIIGAIMLLVPGLIITNAIRDTIAGDLVSGLIRAAEAFLIALSIATGTGAVLSIWFSMNGGI